MNAFEDHARLIGQLQVEQFQQGGRDECPTFKCLGKDWKIVPGSVDYAKNLESGGFTLRGGVVRFTALTAQFPQAPEKMKDAMLEQPMVFNGETWLIKVVSVAPEGHQLEIEAHTLR